MTRYRLRGEVGGTERSYPVPEGELRVGCVGTNDLVLPVRGVSRAHARLASGPSLLEVEDLDSRNGVFLNGARVQRARLRPGDEVRFGPVALRLEEVPSEGAELAIRVSGERAPAGLPSWETTTAAAPVGGSEPRRLLLPDEHVRGVSAAMAALYAQMRPLVDADLPVLIVGETGVGKEHVARALHASSPRRGGPFVAVNCAAIPADLLEAEMFGIAKGVATGVTERSGKLAQADKGTLFLDEIGEMPPALQPKLLRALQEKQVHPVGGPPAAVDVRTLSATNSDLEAKLEKGVFRRDLYFRVAGFVLRVPPLRERAEDIPDLVEAFLVRFARESGRRPLGVTARAMAALREYTWPGNVRELEHEMRRLVHLCPDGQAIESTMLSSALLSPPAHDAAPDLDGASLYLEGHLQRLEDRLIREALRRSGGNRSQAAKLLGVSRNGLALKMERLGITD
ncbi:MAG TPA: sigma 54-interacting transcriptional regulator [Vicinamibacteria bacterium]|nr:sigma 54-interacting transcriptional regulator [Vicinamibacteria bacterium]